MKIIDTVLKWLGIASGLVQTLTPIVPGLSNIGAVITRDLANDAIALHNYEAGQAVLIADVHIPGESKRGVLILCQENGPAYDSLFGVDNEPEVHSADLHGGIAEPPARTLPIEGEAAVPAAEGTREEAIAADPHA